MKIISKKTYNVMDGEPALGKEIITIVSVSRDEYLDAITEAILEGAENVHDIATVRDMYEQEYELSCDLTQDELDSITSDMEEYLIDDDYGTGRDHQFIWDLVNDAVRDNWSDEFEIQELRGY